MLQSEGKNQQRGRPRMGDGGPAERRRGAPQVRVREPPLSSAQGGQQPVPGNRAGGCRRRRRRCTPGVSLSRKKSELLAGSPELSHELREQRAGLPRKESSQVRKWDARSLPHLVLQTDLPEAAGGCVGRMRASSAPRLGSRHTALNTEVKQDSQLGLRDGQIPSIP